MTYLEEDLIERQHIPEKYQNSFESMTLLYSICYTSPSEHNFVWEFGNITNLQNANCIAATTLSFLLLGGPNEL